MNRTVTLAIAIALVAASVAAEEVKDPCKQVDTLARAIMRMRQNGIAASKIVEVIADPKSDLNAQNQATVRSIVIDAYQRPAFSTDEMRDRTIGEFANEYYVACLAGVDRQRAERTP